MVYGRLSPSNLRKSADEGARLTNQRTPFSRRTFVKGVGLGTGTMALGGLAAACGGSTKNASTPSGQPSGQAASATTQSAVKRGGTVVVRRQEAFTFGDPQRAAGGYDVPDLELWAAPLLQALPGNKLAPYLAESWEQTDTSTITLHLRQDLEFSDGTPVNSDSVKYSIVRRQDPSIASTGAPYATQIQSIDTPDATTAVLHLKAPNVTFAQQLSEVHTIGNLVSPTAAEKLGKDGFNEHPVSVGPYSLESFGVSSQMVLKRNPKWPIKAPDGGSLPYPDSMIFKIIPEQTVALASQENGTVDIDINATGDEIATVKNQSQVSYIPNNDADSIQMYMISVKGPLKDVRIRQALCYGIDKSAFVAAFTNGYGHVATGPLSPLCPAYDKTIPHYDYDPDKAAALLSAAGVDGNLELTCLTYPGGFWPQTGALVQAQLKKLGINVTVSTPAFTVYIQQFITNGTVPVATGGGPTSVGDPWSFFQTQFGTTTNANSPQNPQFDQLLTKAAAIADTEERYAVYKDIEMLDYNNAYKDWVLWQPYWTTFNKHIHGIQYLAGGYADLRYVWKD